MKKFLKVVFIVSVFLLFTNLSFATISDDTRVPSAGELISDSVDRWGKYWNDSINKDIVRFFDFSSYPELTFERLSIIVICLLGIISISAIVLLINYIRRSEENIYTVVDTNNVRYSVNYLKNPARSKEIAKLIKKKNKSFNRKEFIANAKKVFVQMESALNSRDFEALRNIETEDLFKKQYAKLQNDIKKGQIEKQESIKVNYAEFSRYFTYHENECIVMIINTLCTRYVLDEKKDKVINGNKDEQKKEYYRLTFIKRLSDKEIADKKINMECPHCGASIKGNVNKCEYCDSEIISYNKWTLNEAECLSDI